MSLPHSSSSTGSSDWLAVLPGVVTDVAEQAFFAMAEPCEPERFARLVAETSHAAQHLPDDMWLHAHVSFRGAVVGALEVLMPDALARSLGATVMDKPFAEPLTDRDLRDVAGELANMVCGALLTRSNRDQPFELRPPLTERAPVKSDQTAPGLELFFCLNDLPVLVRFAVRTT